MTKLNELLKLDLQFFAEDDDPETPATPEKTVTQAELDEIVEKRLARERAKYADYDDLKTKAAEFEAERKRIEDEQLSESERLQKALDAALSERQLATDRATALEEKAEQDRIRAAFIRKASDAGIKYTDAAVKLSDVSTLKFDESGKLVGIDDAINALITDNPFLIEPEVIKPKHVGGGTDAGEEVVSKTSAQRLEEARIKAVKSGLPKDRAAYATLKRELSK